MSYRKEKKRGFILIYIPISKVKYDWRLFFSYLLLFCRTPFLLLWVDTNASWVCRVEGNTQLITTNRRNVWGAIASQHGTAQHIGRQMGGRAGRERERDKQKTNRHTKYIFKRRETQHFHSICAEHTAAPIFFCFSKCMYRGFYFNVPKIKKHIMLQEKAKEWVSE